MQLLRDGTLLRSPTETYETMDYLDKRIAELTAKAERLRGNIATAVAEGEALLAASKAMGPLLAGGSPASASSN